MPTDDREAAPDPPSSPRPRDDEEDEYDAGEADQDPLYVDRLSTPLNACSLEVLHLSLPASDRDRDGGEGQGQRGGGGGGGGGFLPLIVGCYQLDEGRVAGADEGSTGEESDDDSGGCASSDDGRAAGKGAEIAERGESTAEGENHGSGGGATRSGELRLHFVGTCPGSRSEALSFGEPSQVLQTDSGVLDGKWCGEESVPGSCYRGGGGGEGEGSGRYLYGTACASGRVCVYSLSRGTDIAFGWGLERLASSPLAEDASGGGGGRLCLSLDWDRPPRSSSPSPSLLLPSSSTLPWSRRIVSSYSDGTLGVHVLRVGADAAEFEELRTWDAHCLFGVPTEVWTTCFAGDSDEDCSCSQIVASGADDCTLKLWDLRTDLRRPTVKVGGEEYAAGVTAVARHPRLSHVLAAGSYDESVRFWDVRSMAEPLCSAGVGGGVWRVRWHPRDDGRVLVAAMHGGCRVVHVTGLLGYEATSNCSMLEVVSEFKEHKSMAYGADWLVPAQRSDTDPPRQDGESGNDWMAASCSFYDRQAFIWNGRGDQATAHHAISPPPDR